MFEQSTIPGGGTRVRWTVAVAFLGQLLAVGVLILIPLWYVQALPVPELTTMLVAPPPPPPPPPPPAAEQITRVVTRHFDASRLVEPRTIPKELPIINEAPPVVARAGVPGGVVGGIAGGDVGGLLSGILHSAPSAIPAPPPPPESVRRAAAPKPAAPAQIQVGGSVEAARLLDAPKPRYPAMARSARVQGEVKLEAIIGTDGRIRNLTVESGNPILAHAAMDAVEHWVYRPTYLNGKAVRVATEIDVNFELAG